MKTSYLLFALSFCLLSSAACQKSNTRYSDDSLDDDRFPVTVKVCSDVSNPTKVLSIADDKVSSVQILVFRDSVIDAYGSSTTGKSVTVSCTEGDRTIYAVVNGPDCSAITTVADLKAVSFLLSDNRYDNVIMMGNITAKLAPTSAPVGVQVSRLLSRVVLSNVKREMSPASIASMNFRITACYLMNVPGNGNLGDSGVANVWYNGNATNLEEKIAGLIYDSVANGAITNGGSYSTAHSFYTLPTARSSKTMRLVIEAVYGNKTCYYPVDIPALASNQSYEIKNVVIKRPGSDSPDKPVSFSDITFTVEVVSWDESTFLNELSI